MINLNKLNTVKAGPLETDADWRAFADACVKADTDLGRPKLLKCKFSAISLGLYSVARMKVKKINTRKMADEWLKCAFRNAKLDATLLSCLPDSIEYCNALDDLEDSMIALCVASNEDRPKIASQAWSAAASHVVEIVNAEGYGDILE